jgi:3-hydroxybutyryl-CoA dehydrogenase
MKIEKVAVLGAGLMGNQIAMQIALHGFNTVCYSRRKGTTDNAISYAENWFRKSVEKGRLTEDVVNKTKTRLSFTNNMEEACKDADIVVETVADILEVKRKVLAEADKLTPDHTIFASNSSYIVSSRFCDVVKNPGKVCNMHFFNPALVMKVVEVVRGPHTSPDTIDTVYEFTKAIGKEPVLVEKEIYGFIVNRIFSALTREACYLVDLGIASPGEIDKAVKGGLGHPMGPLELLDMTGIDLEYNVYMEKFRMTRDLADRPAACLTEMYARGEYGRKTGKGFYEYKKKEE